VEKRAIESWSLYSSIRIENGIH